MVATGACDNIIRLRSYVDEDWKEVEELKAMCKHIQVAIIPNQHIRVQGIFFIHSWLDWVRDIAWTPNNLIPYNIIASCSEDRHIFIWKQTEAGKLSLCGKIKVHSMHLYGELAGQQPEIS